MVRLLYQSLVHTHHKHNYSKPPETSTDAHQEKLDLVKHSDDAHEAPPLGCTLDEGCEGNGRKACGAGYCDLFESRLDDDMRLGTITEGVYKHTLQLGKKFKRW